VVSADGQELDLRNSYDVRSTEASRNRGTGKQRELLFSRKAGVRSGAFDAPEDILDFLNKWKPSAAKN